MVILGDVDMISTWNATYNPLNNQGRFGLNVTSFLAEQAAQLNPEFRGSGNAILGNSIHSNAGLGIDLKADGVTLNDPIDQDDGANRLLNYPVLAEIAPEASSVLGTYDGAADAFFRLEFFVSPSVDSSGHGEGRTFLGWLDIVTDGDGHAEFEFSPEAGLPSGRYVTATATDAEGNTSEFSLAERAPVVVTDQGNGGFETGDFTHWNISESRPGLAEVVTVYQETTETYLPIEGEFFALLQTGFEDQFTSISQDFVAAAGETLSGWAFFDTTEFDTFFNDEAEIRILQNGQLVATVFAASVPGVGGDDGHTPWTFWEHTFAEGGTYTLEARVTNRQDGVVDSFLGIDAMSFDSVGNVAPSITSLATSPAAPIQFDNVELTIGFADPNAADTHLVTVDWGNGETSTFELTGGERELVADHAYQQAGSFQILTTVSDNFGANNTQTLIVDVAAANVAPTINSLTTDAASIDQFRSVELAIDFTDPNAADTHFVSVAWGDGATSFFELTGGERGLVTDHAYQQAGAFQIVATVSDNFGGSDTESAFVDVVANTAPTIGSVTTNPASIDQFGSVEYTLNFTDPDAADAHRIVVDWGDGTRETFDLDDGERSGAANHTYHAFGPFSITVTVSDDRGGSDTDVFAILVNAAAPEILSAGLASQSDSGIAGDNLTNVAQPLLQFTVVDPSPGPTGALTFRIDVGNDGVFDQQTTLFALGGSPFAATIALAQPLAEGAHTIVVQVVDAAGNADTATIQLVVDRTPPVVVASSVSSVDGRLQFVLELSEDLDPAAAENLAHYVLMASGRDGGFLEGNEVNRTSAAVVGYTPAGGGLPARIVVRAPLADDTYRLTIDVDALVDRAGSALATGDVTLRAVHDTIGPQVQDVVAFNIPGGQPAIFIDFAQPLDPASVVAANFTLELPDGSSLRPLEALYASFGNRVILRVPELAAGRYILTVQNLRSAVGTPQNRAIVQSFDVEAGTTFRSEVLAGNAESLNTFTTQLLEQAETAHASLSENAFLQSVLAAARDAFGTFVGSAEEVAAAVSDVVLQLFGERAEAQGSQNEYIVVWGRFVGIELRDAIVLNLPGHPEWSMALLRVQAAAGSPLVTSSEAVGIVTEGVTGEMDEIVATLTGLQGVNSGGVIYLSPGGDSVETFVNVSATPTERTLRAAHISGFSLVEAIDAQVQADFAALFGVSDLSQVPGDYLIIWFDPVDFVLTNAQGQQVGHVGGTTVNQVPNAFYSGDGMTELLVIPNATGGDYNLSLVGAGSEFRGTATFVSNGQVVSIPLQGTLASGNNVVAVLDFRGLGVSEPPPAGQEFTGLERPAGGLEALAAAFSNAALAGIVSFAPGSQEEVRAPAADNALPPMAQANGLSAFVLQQADGALLTTFSLPAENGMYRLGIVQLQTDDRAFSGPRPIEVRLQVSDEASRIEIVFDRDLTPEQVAAAEQVVLVWAGPDGEFNTPDDESFAVEAGEVEYDAESKTVRIAGRKLPPGKYLVKLDLSAAEAAEAAPADGQQNEAPANGAAAAPAEGETEADRAAVFDQLWRAWPAAATTEELLARLRPADAEDQNAWFESYRDNEPADDAASGEHSRWAYAAGVVAVAAVATRPRVRIRRRQKVS